MSEKKANGRLENIEGVLSVVKIHKDIVAVCLDGCFTVEDLQKIEKLLREIQPIEILNKEEIKMKPFHCRARCCRRVVAQTDGNNLYINGKPLPLAPHYLAFSCPFCKSKIRWTRDEKVKIVS